MNPFSFLRPSAQRGLVRLNPTQSDPIRSNPTDRHSALRFSLVLQASAFILCLALCQSAHATSYTWTKDAAGTQTWTDAGNWAPSQFADGTANELVFFSDTTTALATGTNFITAALPTTGTMNILTLNGKGAAATGPTNIVIGTNASTWTLGGTTPTVNLNGVNGTQALSYTVAPNLSLLTTTTFAANGSAGFNFTGNISGAGAISKTGGGTLTLSGNSSFTGGVNTNNNGTLVLKTSNAAGTGQITYAFSTLKLDNSGMGQNIWLPNALSTNGSTFSNVAGDNRVNGSFNLNSGSSNSYIMVDGGTLEITGGYGAGTTNRTAHLQGAYTGLWSGNITFGTNIISKESSGTWIFSGANTYNQNTAVTAGTLIGRSSNAFGSSPVTVSANANLSYVATTDATLNLSQTLAITGGANTVIGSSIGATATSAEIKVTGAATATAANVKVNVFGINGVTPLAGTNTYTLVHSNTSTSTLNSGTYALGMVYNNTNFTVGAPTATTTDLQVAITSTTALTTAYWKGGLTGGTNIWAASNGSTQSNWTATSGGADQALVPGIGADVTISNSAVTTAPTSTYLGADMTVKSLTIADTANGLGLGNDFFTLTISPTVSSAGITVNTSVPASTINSRVKLGTAQTWTNDSANALTVSGIISGTGSLTKSGTGSLVLSGWNTYTGDTSVNQGTLRLSNQIAAQSSTVVMNGGTLVLDQSVIGNAFTFGGLAASSSGAGYDIALQNNAGTPAAIALTVGGNNANTTYAGVLSGSGSLTKAGSGTLTLSGSNTYTGMNTLSSGTLSISLDANIGASTSGITFNGGGLQVTGTTMNGVGTHPVTYVASKAITLDINNASNNFNLGTASLLATDTLTKLGAGTLTLGAATNALTTLNINANSIVDIGVGALTIANGGASTIQSTTGGTINATGGGSIVLGANSDDVGTAAGTTLTINAPITGIAANQFEIYNSGAGTVVLTNTNTFAGNVLVSTGILSVAKIGNQGSTTSALGSGTTITLGNGATTAQLKYTGTGETTDRIVNVNNGASNVAIDQSGSGLLKFSGAISGATGGNGTKTLTLQGSTAGTGEISGAVGNGSAGTLAVTKAGTGTWTLSGTNTYLGKTTVNAGTLQFAKASALYTSSTGSWTKANIVVNSGGTLAFNVGGPNDFTSADFTTLLGNLTGDVSTGGFKAGSAIGLNTANATGSVTVADILANTAGTGGGSFGFTKSGAGTVILSGSNTYTGTTTIAGGMLQANNASALGTSGTITFTGGTLQFNGSSAGQDWSSRIKNSTSAISIDTNSQFVTWSGALATSNTAGLIKLGAGTLDYRASAFTGPIAVQAGNLLNRSTAMGTLTLGGTSGGVTLNEATSSNLTSNIVIASDSTGVTINNYGNYNPIFGGTISIPTGKNLTVANSNSSSSFPDTNISLNGAISGDGNMSTGGGFNGGMITYSGANTFTGGLTIYSSSGYVRVGVDSVGSVGAITSGAFGTGTLTLSGGTLVSDGTSARTILNPVVIAANCSLGDNSAAPGPYNGALTFAAQTALGTAVRTLTVNSAVEFQGAVTGTGGGITKAGPATLTLSASNSYTGGTTLTSGTLVAGSNSALGTGLMTLDGGSLASYGNARSIANDITVKTSTVGQITGDSITFTGMASGAAGTLNVNLSGTAKTMTVNRTSDDGFAPGKIQLTQGTLLLGGSNVIGNSTNIDLAGGTLNTGGNTETAGALTLSANSTIDFSGSQTGDVAFTDANYSGGLLTINNWVGSFGGGSSTHLVFTGSIDPGFLSQVQFTGGGYSQGANAIVFGGGGYELAPIPEPATIVGAVAFVGLIFLRERRRFFGLITKRQAIV